MSWVGLEVGTKEEMGQICAILAHTNFGNFLQFQKLKERERKKIKGDRKAGRKRREE